MPSPKDFRFFRTLFGLSCDIYMDGLFLDGVRLLNRDEFEAVVVTHQAEVYRYVRYLGAIAATAEDITQDTFLAAIRRTEPWEKLDERSRAAWFRGIARNLFLQSCRKAQRGETTVDPTHLQDAEATWKEEFLRGGDGFDYLEALRHCLESLSERDGRAIALRYRERASRKRMADLLELSENGIKSLLRRIRAALAECVNKRLALGDAR